MYTGIKHLHSFLPYLLLTALLLSIIILAYKRSSAKPFTAADKRLALITLILAHVQLLAGLVLYFVSPITKAAFQSGEVMSNAVNRFYAVEHALLMLIAITLITIGYSKSKRQLESSAKFKTLVIFFVIALVLALSRIPWDVWPS